MNKKLINISNGFSHGQTLLSFSHGKWNLIYGCGPCKWVGDESVMKEFEAPSRGAVVTHYDGWSKVRFLGFGDNELGAKVAEFFVTQYSSNRCRESTLENTWGRLQEAKLLKEEMIRTDKLPDGVHTMPYRWGDQRAEHLVLIKHGKVLDQSKMVGDNVAKYNDTYDEATSLREGRLVCSSEHKRREKLRSKYESFKRKYQGTRLYQAARKAGFGEFVPE